MNNTIRNFFRDGLIMDLAPDNTQNSQLTNALNATFVTFNGNELSLQNDMGNARVETAMLPEGYIPIGSAELGGIIYIAAFNPFTNKCQLGSFPSPERNLEKEEIAPNSFDVQLSADKFQELNGEEPTGELKTTLHKIDLGMPILHPGDKFYVCADNITTLVNDGSIWDGTKGYVDIYLATINSENKIVKLELSEKSSGHVIGEAPVKKESENYDIDSYRKTMKSNYDVYTAKESGKLYIVAELVTIDDFEASIKVNKSDVYLKVESFSKYVGIKPKELVITCLLKYGTVKPGEISPQPSTARILYQETAILLNNYNFTFQEDAIYEFTITPVMDYGYLSNLKVNLTVFCNSKIETNISEWRYYNADEYINLKFTINSTIQSNELELNFYEYDNTDFSNTPNFTIKYNNLFSVSKNYTETIYLDKEYDTDYFYGILNKNKFYRVSIKLGTEELKEGEGEEKTTYYLYVYTCPIFNGFYENQNYYIKKEVYVEESQSYETIAEVHSEPLYNFNLIDYTYGYEDNGIVYPLTFKTTIEFISGDIKSNIYNETYTNLDKVVNTNNDENVEVSHTYKLEVQDKCIVNLKLAHDYGELFKLTSEKPSIYNKISVNQESLVNVYNNGILTLSRDVTNKITLDYQQNLVNVYNFKPLVYNEVTAAKYGITLNKSVPNQLGNVYCYARSILGTYPMWYFFSEKHESNKDFQSGTFIPNWETGGSFSDDNHMNVGGNSYRYLNMYDSETVQYNINETIKNCTTKKLPIVPHLFGFWEESNTCSEFDVIGNNINDNYILSKYDKIHYNDSNYYIKYENSEKPSIYYQVKENSVRLCNDASRVVATYEDAPKIWSFVMLDENGEYKPINCFMIQTGKSDGLTVSVGDDSVLNSTECVSVGETGESMMKQILDMLMSIYKVSDISNQPIYIGHPNNFSTSNDQPTIIIISYKAIKLNITKKEEINNLNYYINSEKQLVLRYLLQDAHKNDIINKVNNNVSHSVCKIDAVAVNVPNLNPDYIYYKVDGDLRIMDKNFIWENSQYIQEKDGIIERTMPTTDVPRITNWNPEAKTVLYQDGQFYAGYTVGKNEKVSLDKINIYISGGEGIDGIEGSFSGIPIIKIWADQELVKTIYLEPIGSDGNLIKSQENFKTNDVQHFEQIIEFDESIDFTIGVVISISNLSVKGPVQATINLYGLITYIPESIVINSGIGEYLTLKDGMLCLKGGLSGYDRSVAINAGGPNYITDWKFNSQIQFKNEFAI